MLKVSQFERGPVRKCSTWYLRVAEVGGEVGSNVPTVGWSVSRSVVQWEEGEEGEVVTAAGALSVTTLYPTVVCCAPLTCGSKDSGQSDRTFVCV